MPTPSYFVFVLLCAELFNLKLFVIVRALQIGTGFKDDDLEKHSTFFREHIIDRPRPYYSYSSGIEPDHWFDAVQVWEVKAADLSISPMHKAAIGLVSG